MLIGGADVSGSKTDGQQNHAALVVGKEDAINRIYNNIGISPIHMSEMSQHQRCQVYDRLDFSSDEAVVWCFHVSRHRAVNSMKERIASGKKRKPKTNIHKSFDSYWFQLFRDTLTDFAANFRAELSDIAIEADADMLPTVKNWNINGRYKGKAYELADAVAWFNQKGDKIQNCKVMDLRDAITWSMERHLLK